MLNVTLVYVGTYTDTKSKGIYFFRLQTENLEVSQNITLVPLGLAAESRNPSFIELDLERRLLFAVNEVDQFEGKPTGAVSAFSIDGVSRYNSGFKVMDTIEAATRESVAPSGRSFS